MCSKILSQKEDRRVVVGGESQQRKAKITTFSLPDPIMQIH